MLQDKRLKRESVDAVEQWLKDNIQLGLDKGRRPQKSKIKRKQQTQLKQQQQIIKARFGAMGASNAVRSYVKVAQTAGVKLMTAWYTVQRYLKNGCRLAERRSPSEWLKPKLSGEVLAEILKPEALKNWACLSL